jgi:L-ascorbate metabolism protein UlaG (beta-lactamase superfamily)
MSVVEITYFGHSCVGIDVEGTHLLIDPFLSDNPIAGASPEEVQADYVLISHGHGDHVGDAVQIARRTGATTISNFEIQNWLAAQGLEKTHPLHIGGGFDFPFGRVKLTIAHHGSALPDGGYGGAPAGFLLTLAGKKIYHACDTGLFYDMKLIGEEGLALALLPIGDNFTMGPDDALRAVKLLEPKVVIPVHYNTWDLIAQDPHAFAGRVEAETSSRCVVLDSGESYRL